MHFNNDIKSEFIANYVDTRVVSLTSLSAIFNKTAVFEKEYDKDCSQFNKEEILAMYHRFNAKAVSVLENYNVYLKNYTLYRIRKNQIANENAYDDISKNLLQDCIDPSIEQQRFITREQLDDIENILFNYTDKAILESLWYGISGKSMRDLVSLDESMLSADKHSLIFPDGRELAISNKLSEYLNGAFSETTYLSHGFTHKIIQLYGNGRLYKQRSNAYAAPSDDKYFRWVYRKVQIYREYLRMPLLTMKTIQASGLFDALQKGMKENNCSMRTFLTTTKGRALASQYGFKENHYVDVICDKFEGYETSFEN